MKYKKVIVSRVGTFGTESAVRKRGGSRNLPYLKCEATANSVTGHVCVNSKIDKNYNPKQNTGKSKDIMRYATEKHNENMYFK